MSLDVARENEDNMQMGRFKSPPFVVDSRLTLARFSPALARAILARV